MYSVILVTFGAKVVLNSCVFVSGALQGFVGNKSLWTMLDYDLLPSPKLLIGHCVISCWIKSTDARICTLWSDCGMKTWSTDIGRNKSVNWPLMWLCVLYFIHFTTTRLICSDQFSVWCCSVGDATDASVELTFQGSSDLIHMNTKG